MLKQTDYASTMERYVIVQSMQVMLTKKLDSRVNDMGKNMFCDLHQCALEQNETGFVCPICFEEEKEGNDEP